jgi:hypothetical protein
MFVSGSLVGLERSVLLFALCMHRNLAVADVRSPPQAKEDWYKRTGYCRRKY